MAQQFHSLFSTGIDNLSISTIDPAGVALKAIQVQQNLIQSQEQKIKALEQQLIELQNAVRQLQNPATGNSGNSNNR